MSTSLVPFTDMERMASAIAKSNLFGMKTPDQVLALMLIAQAEGRHPAIVARDYDIIQGRPAKKAEAMLRDFLESGGTVEWHRLDDECADATFSHPHGGTARISWDVARAKKAGITNAMYSKYPRQMYRSRCVSEGVRTVYPASTSGMYEPGEVRQITIDAKSQDPATPHTGGATVDDLVGKQPPFNPPTEEETLSDTHPLKAAPSKPQRTWEEVLTYTLAKIANARHAPEPADGETLLAGIRAGLPKYKFPSAMQQQVDQAIAEADNALSIGATLVPQGDGAQFAHTLEELQKGDPTPADDPPADANLESLSALLALCRSAADLDKLAASWEEEHRNVSNEVYQRGVETINLVRPRMTA